MDLLAYSIEHGLTFRRKDRSRLMRAIGLLLGLLGVDFMRSFWTTVGRTVHFPVSGPDIGARYHPKVRPRVTGPGGGKVASMDEAMDLELPLPVGLAWFRWYWERGPYLYQIIHYGRPVEPVVGVLWRAYLCWPRPWMRRWFQAAQLEARVKARRGAA
jgi:hypothetical protein